MNASLREVKAKLAWYLRKAHAGQDVVITSRGRPMARLVAVSDEAAGRPSGEEMLERLKLLPGVRLGARREARGSEASGPDTSGPESPR
ncbi:MAG: type II toxin-antitoxin system Phd/YefM family antitoxin [Terriglobia bacterium]